MEIQANGTATVACAPGEDSPGEVRSTRRLVVRVREAESLRSLGSSLSSNMGNLACQSEAFLQAVVTHHSALAVAP